jgi:N-acetylglucosamine kinase-like BadF-type ATPase
MFCIVDSGSTKTTWSFIKNNEEVLQIKTPGINPYYQESAAIYESYRNTLDSLAIEVKEIEKLFYYGAGCERKDKKEIVVEGLKKYFTNISIEIESDLIGAARALFVNDSGIACISGTGANTCLFINGKVQEQVPSLGLYLGDEGSGGHIGKLLIHHYLRNALPLELKEKLEAYTSDRSAEMMDKIYKQPFPNRYLASFAKFVVQEKDHDYIRQIINGSFKDLFENYLIHYSNYKNYPIRFIGSIAFYLKNEIQEVAISYGVQVDKVIVDPIPGLIEYHTKN